jgi:two-component system, NtrC family, sensor histidine kinase HydH
MLEDGSFVHEFAPEVVRQVDRMEGWVKRLLSYAYQPARALEPVSPNLVARMAAQAVEKDLARQGITLELSLADDLPTIPAQRDALEHALANLVSNAIEAMPGGGRLALQTRIAPDRRGIEMVVTDSGQGIPQDRLDRIFAPFHTTKAAGLGVGLPMVKRTVERLGGRIDVSSRLGAGTTFRLTLPMASR